MPREETGSSTSSGGREALLGSLARMGPVAGDQDLPPYGEQHRQDALWEGGNAALPPQWHQFKVPDGGTRYEDDTLIMTSSNRPLPGGTDNANAKPDAKDIQPDRNNKPIPEGNDFFGNDANRAPRYAPPGSPSSPIRWRHLLSPIHFGASSRIVDVAPGRKKNRIAIAPLTKAELDAAMQRANGNEADGSMRPGQPALGTQEDTSNLDNG
ncbi:hypothetical protein BDR03DRAFT_1013782 [Suillus americanus]|nr:hypothetical protein BDR03DRAFT_1013782 [Suillus americanus]